MPTATDAEQFRAVLGHFPSGVTIVTGTTPSGPAGFTCQSFSSLSLDPPLVLMLPSRSSTSWPPIAETGRFCVNVLADHQEQLSAWFARSGAAKFVGVTWSRSPLGCPILDGVCAWIDCEIDQVHDGGDHLIVVGAVSDLAADSQQGPLLFHRGGYARTNTAEQA